MRLPYRQRFSLIVNELGAAAAARSGDLQAALHRAVPALDETDNLLNLLANDSTTLQALTKDSNSVITALANNSQNVNKFIDVAGKTAADTATQQGNLRTSLQRLPGLLQQLKPTIAQLGTTVTTNEPVLQNLNQASGQIDRLLTDLPAFSKSAKPAIKSLGQASITGQSGRDGGHADGQGPQRLRQADPRAGGQPGHRPARPRRPQPRGRARPAQPRRQRLHGAPGAAGLRVQPDAGRQHLRPRGPRPRRRRLRQPDVLALRHAGHRRPGAQAVRAGLPPVLLLARAQPARRQRDRPVEPERPRARSGRSAPRPERAQHQREPPHRGRGAERHQRQQEAARRQEDQEEGQGQGQRGQRTPAPTPRRRRPARAPPPAPPPPRPAPAAAQARPSTSARRIGQVLQGTVGGTPAPQPAQPVVPAPTAPSGSGSSSSPGGTAQQLLNYLLSP